MSKKKKQSHFPDLTFKNKPKEEVSTLTRYSDGIFRVAFVGQAKRGYDFGDCSSKDWHKLGKFLDKNVGKPVKDVGRNNSRGTDSNDKDPFGEPMLHYAYGKSERLHGYNKDGYFIVTRIDPNHKFHK